MTTASNNTQLRVNPFDLASGATGSVLAATTDPARKSEVSRVDNMVLGQCPVCKNRMSRLMAESVPAYVCMNCRVCLPMENQNL
jgi:hypothetical protein